MVGHEKRWFATARTATKPENMQGFHEDNMLFIIDEASGELQCRHLQNELHLLQNQFYMEYYFFLLFLALSSFG